MDTNGHHKIIQMDGQTSWTCSYASGTRSKVDSSLAATTISLQVCIFIVAFTNIITMAMIIIITMIVEVPCGAASHNPWG